MKNEIVGTFFLEFPAVFVGIFVALITIPFILDVFSGYHHQMKYLTDITQTLQIIVSTRIWCQQTN